MREPFSFAAIVLAGSRPGGDPVARHCGVPSKAQVEVAGQPLLLRVLAALDASARVTDVTVVGLPAAALADAPFAAALERSNAQLVAGAATPSASVAAALAARPDDAPVLVTTADHALLSARIVEAFLAAAEAQDADVVIGLTRHEQVDALLPGMRRTVLRFADGGFCGCNLFAFKSARGRRATSFWQRLEAHRKHPVRMARLLGPLTLLRFLFGRLRLDQACARLSSMSGARILAVVVPYPEAAVDVDKPEDLAVAESLLTRPAAHSADSGSQSSSRNAPPPAS